jgi:hypothetical protein
MSNYYRNVIVKYHLFRSRYVEHGAEEISVIGHVPEEVSRTFTHKHSLSLQLVIINDLLNDVSSSEYKS